MRRVLEDDAALTWLIAHSITTAKLVAAGADVLIEVDRFDLGLVVARNRLEVRNDFDDALDAH